MRKIYIIFAMALLLPLTTLAQGWPANYGGVMLQGFFWDSYKETPDCSPFGPWQYHQSNDATATHQPGYTWATIYGAGWTSGEEWQVPVTTWTSLLAHKDEITPYIDLLWLPQSGSTVADSTMIYYTSEDNSGRGGVRPWRNGQNWGYSDGSTITNPDCMGFVPVFYFHHGLSYQYNDQGELVPWTYTDGEGRTWTPISYFGTEAELRELISTFKAEGTGAIEDVVANHRGGLGTWAGDKNSIEFPTEWYQGTFCPEGEFISWTSDDVCCDDESGRGTGNPDCGGQGQWARDIDHHSPVTRAKVLKFLDFLKNDLGYVGYRYDYAMGFEEKHFAEYNTTLRPTFSVGEYWGSKGDISNWIHKTYMEGTYQSAAFDFPLQSDIREAFNYGNYRYLNNSGLISDPVLKRYAVTFLDNHDTFKDLPTDGSNYNWSNGKAYQHRVEKNIVEANAFILAMPGTPCLFYPHFMHPQWHETLVLLIKARRTAGITNESERSEAELKGNNGIQWIVTGSNGQVCFQLGDAVSDGCPEGFTPVWESDPDENGYKVARYSITSSLYDEIEKNEKKNLINGYPVIDRNSCTFSGSMTVKVKPSTEGCTLAYTTNGQTPTASDNIITQETSLTINDNITLKVGVVVDDNVPTSSVVTRQYVRTATESDKINFYVCDNNAPYLYVYYYDNNGNKYEPFGAWRGYLAFEQVQVGGINWWHVQMDKPDYPVNLIINWEGSQTPDIDGITSDVFYTVKDGQPNNVTNTYMPMIENPDLTIDIRTGSYEGAVSPKIVSSYSGATIVYTTDGTEPTASSPTIASGSSVTFNTDGNHYLRAGILKDGEVINQVARSYYITNGHGEGVNIYVKNMTTNDAPHIHAWNGEGTALTSPGFDDGGERLTETVENCGQTWYKKHFDDVPSGILFMLNDRKDMTGNITYLQEGQDYYFYYYPGAHFGDNAFQPGYIDVTADSKHTTDVKAITVFMYDNGNADWSNGIKLYPYANNSQIFWNWDGSWAESAFPTTTMGGQSWFYCTFLGKEEIGAILYNGANSNERFEVSHTDTDVFMKFPIANDNWTTGQDLTGEYAQYLPDVEKPEEGDNVTPEQETIIPDCAVAMDDCLYFYFENASFGAPYAWVYSNTNTYSEHGFPGEALTEVVGTAPNGNLVYRWTYSDDSSHPSDVIFTNNGQNEVGPFEFVNGGYYTTSGMIGEAHEDILTLAQILQNGKLGEEYLISNDLTAVITLEKKEDVCVFAKDADGDALEPSINDEDRPIHPVVQDWYFDQSNWVEFKLPGERDLTLDDMSLMSQTVVGRLVEKTPNPLIELLANPIPNEEMSYIPNNYLVANYRLTYADENYFFVQPKKNEYNILKYAVYRGNGKFDMANQSGENEWDIPELNGEIRLSGEQPYYQGETELDSLFDVNGVYNLEVISKMGGRTPYIAVVNATKIGMFEENMTPLAEVLESGVDNTEYRIAEDLAVAAAPMGQNFAFLTDGSDNWIKVVFESESDSEAAIIESFMTQNAIKGGTLKGRLYNHDLNPYIELTAIPEVGEEPVDYNIETVNLDEEFVLKENQVIDVTGYWNDKDGALRAYAPSNAIQGQSLTLSTDWLDGVSLANGTLYQVRAAITLKEPWQTQPSGINLLDYDYDFQNYLAYAVDEPTSNIPTGVVDINNGVIAVRYYNLQGIEIASPTQGVNIVVREYDNGRHTVSKVLFK
ncbi:MAG: chitobiase/beta-hexosaminidase C-terminal domain-containing protein [Muribaculaceae bacterium]|nr:chitobiase/beta-hexosaminidase C-terminal domain-containing protein [Muribaculaceae bacterium]